MHSSQKANSSMHKSNPYRYPWLLEPEYKSVKKEFKKDSLKKHKSVYRSRSNSKNQTWNNGLVPNWERGIQCCMLSSCLFNLYAEHIMRKAGLEESRKKLESRLPGEISITSEMQMTPPLWQKVKKN